MSELAIKVFLRSPHPSMPNIILSSEEIDAVAAHIHSLNKKIAMVDGSMHARQIGKRGKLAHEDLAKNIFQLHGVDRKAAASSPVEFVGITS